MTRRGNGITVAFQGCTGANGERAIVAHWHGAATALSMRSFPALVTAVADGMADFGVVPVWNSTIGDVEDACAALARAGDRVEQVGELSLPVCHALLALPGVRIDDLCAIGSHPAALDQCSRFFTEHPAITPVPAWDTAGAARDLARFAAGGEPDAWVQPWHAAVTAASPETLGVIANASLAAPLGLDVLAEDIQDDPANVTRFAVVQPRRRPWRW